MTQDLYNYRIKNNYEVQDVFNKNKFIYSLPPLLFVPKSSSQIEFKLNSSFVDKNTNLNNELIHPKSHIHIQQVI